jgi:CheY-like chemotaxis protein
MMIHSILLVDNDLDALEAMRRILQPQGYAVSVATDGKEAIEFLSRKPVDLVITDIVMREVDGFEVIMALRNNLASTRIIAISGDHSLQPDSYLTLAKGFGADEVLPKPVTRDRLMGAIHATEDRPWIPASGL